MGHRALKESRDHRGRKEPRANKVRRALKDRRAKGRACLDRKAQRDLKVKSAHKVRPDLPEMRGHKDQRETMDNKELKVQKVRRGRQERQGKTEIRARKDYLVLLAQAGLLVNRGSSGVVHGAPSHNTRQMTPLAMTVAPTSRRLRTSMNNPAQARTGISSPARVIKGHRGPVAEAEDFLARTWCPFLVPALAGFVT